jgi:Ca2+-binding RTX toxin-like protein
VLAISAATVSSGLGTVTIENGQLRYNPGTAYNGLGAGQTAVVVLSYTISDGNGGTDTASVTVTITGAADGVTPPPTEAGADPNDFDGLVGTSTPGFLLVNGTNTAETLTGDTSSNDKDIINGLGGNDTINAGDATDQVYGGNGDDIINGGDNSDLLYGQAGVDTIHGNQISDDIYGGSEGDVIFGDAGDDTIYGGSGNDTINGGLDNDNIIGGYGADTLTGGGGNDTFRYLSTLDTNDIIVDFMASGNDQIDLSAIDATPGGLNDPFAWGGTTATANGVWFSYDAGSNTTTLYADTDGNASTAELMLTLQNYNGLNPFGSPLTPPADITL